MTLREMVEVVGIDDNPMECAFCIAGFLRTVVQGEASTFEGECASLNKLHELTGKRIDDPKTIRWWLSDLGKVPDMEAPDSIWLSLAADADSDNDTEEE